MVPWSSTGDVLRWWRRDVLGLSQQLAADRLSVQPSALSNWERGARAISVEYQVLDEALGANGALSGLLWALGTTKGLDPARTWTHVFPGPPTPVWLWLRAPVPRLQVVAEWGVARVEPELELGENGVFITAEASVGESPLVVRLSDPGWADFGRGMLPRKIPGAEVMSALELLRRSSASGPFMDMFVTNLANKLSGSKSKELAALAMMAPQAVASFLSRFNRTTESFSTGPWSPVPDTMDEFDRLRFARLRRARGLSLAETVDELVKQADISISKETLRRFETDVGQPHDRLLPAALDQVLGAAGRLNVTRIRSGRGNGMVGFPRFWLGTVWLELHGPNEERILGLHWGDWVRSMRIVPPVLLAFTCSTPEAPVRVAVADDVDWEAGLGVREGATAIDQNWVPISVGAAQRALSETEAALIRALRLRRASEEA